MWILDFSQQKQIFFQWRLADWLAGWLGATFLYFSCTRHLFRCQHSAMVDSRHFFLLLLLQLLRYSRWWQATKIDDEFSIFERIIHMNFLHHLIQPLWYCLPAAAASSISFYLNNWLTHGFFVVVVEQNSKCIMWMVCSIFFLSLCNTWFPTLSM